MAILLTDAITEKAINLHYDGATLKKIRGFLNFEEISNKEIDVFIKAQGWGSTAGKFTMTQVLERLEKGISETQLYEAILENESKNEARWVSNRNAIRLTLNKVYSNFGEPVEEEAASKELKESVKALWK